MALRYNMKNSKSSFGVIKARSITDTDREARDWFSPEIKVKEVMRNGVMINVSEHNERIFKETGVQPPQPMDCRTRY